MSRRLTPSLAALAVLAGAVAGCGNGDERPSEGTSPPSFVGTTPPGSGPGTLPPAVGVSSLEGVRLQLRKVAEVREPVAMATRPGTTTVYLAEKTGRVKAMTIERDVTDAGEVMRADFRVDPDPVLDITSSISTEGERGLLGLAFSGDGGELYVYSTDRQGTITIDAYRMDGDEADTDTKRNVLRIPHPRGNHNGGQLALGPDGYLYAGVGDGGGGGDPDRNGQDPTTLLGAILRIDPSRPGGDRGYAIPDGNPFGPATIPPGAPEVWAYGLRNPWRFSFDRETRDLWIGDVGQSAWEEINYLPDAPQGAGRGANLGWNRMEGTHPYEGGTPPEDHTPPLFDYPRSGGACTVIGGYVYRGRTHPDWRGMYVWADYCLGRIHLLLRRPDGRVEDRDTGLTTPSGDLLMGGSITSFGEDSDGELYALSASGGVYRLEPA